VPLELADDDDDVEQDKNVVTTKTGKKILLLLDVLNMELPFIWYPTWFSW
jgi:hypothetical protein